MMSKAALLSVRVPGLIAALLCAAALAGAAAGCETAKSEVGKPQAGPAADPPPGKAADDAVPVRTALASTLKGRDFIEATGTLSSEQDVVVMAAVSGSILKIHADEGEFVKKGKPLVRIDSTDFRIQVSQAQIGLASAKLALVQTQTDYDRMKNLYESGSIPQSQIDAMKLKLDVTQAQVDAASDGVKMARRYLGYTVVKAPFDCYVVSRMVSVGARIVSMPPTSLMRVIDMAHLVFKMPIPEADARHLKEGDGVAVWFDSLQKEIPGTIHKIIGSVDPMTLTFIATVKIDNEALGFALKPGSFGKGKIYSPGLAGAYVLDKEALAPGSLSGGKGTVFVARDGRASARAVSLEELDAVRVRVTEGLSDGDEVILTGGALLKDGKRIAASGAGE